MSAASAGCISGDPLGFEVRAARDAGAARYEA
jgi:hypothetical protein